MFGLLFLLIFIGVFAFAINKILRLKRKVNTQTFAHYQSQHPDLVKDGRVTCFSCGGKSIHLQTIGNTPSSIWKAHTCRTCGTILYYSKGNI